MGKFKLGMLLLAVAGITGMMAQIENVSAASYVATYVGATVRSNWVRVSSKGHVSMEVVPSAGGAMSVARDEVYVETNSSTGYRLFVSGVDAETDGYTALYLNGDKASAKFAAVPTVHNPEKFHDVNEWGYALASAGFSSEEAYLEFADQGTVTDQDKIIGTHALKWRGMKKEYAQIAASATSNEGHVDTVPVYYGVYVGENTMTGSYRNVVVYTAFVEGGDTITMSPNAVVDEDRVTILTEHENETANPVTAGQIEVSLYNKNNATLQIGTCDNIVVDSTNNGAYGMPLKFTCTIHKGANAVDDTLYDMIVKVDPLGNGIAVSYTAENSWQFTDPIPKMQTARAVDTCKASTAGTLIEMVDNRDDKHYYVAKLADGKCWMMQDLDLDLYINEAGSGQGNMYAKKLGGGTTLLSNENTDISTATWNVSGSHKAYNTQETIGTAWDSYGRNGGTDNTYEVRSFDNYITVSGEVKRNVCMKSYSTKTADSDKTITNPNAVVCGTAGSGTEASEVGEANTQRIGNYYNWPAATAGTGYHNYPSANQYDHATSSICPAGWHLPTGSQSSTTGGEFNTMLKLEIPAITATGGTNYTGMTDPIMQKLTGYTNADNGYKLTFLRSGLYYYSSAAVASRGSYGNYWSSTVYNANNAFYLYFSASNVYPGTNYYFKGFGFSVRCVAD